MESLWHMQPDRYDQSSVLMRNHTCFPFTSWITPHSSAKESTSRSPLPPSAETPRSPTSLKRSLFGLSLWLE